MQEEAVILEQAEEQTPEAVQTPEAREADTRALERELERLRAEERRRQLTDEARTVLESRGLEAGFVPFVLGADSAETRQRVEQLERCLDRALRHRLTAVLPNSEPRDFLVTKQARRCRGIRRV